MTSTSNDCLFSWSASSKDSNIAQSCCFINDICICGVNQVIASLNSHSAGADTASLISVDTNTGQQIAKWKRSSINTVCLGYSQANNVVIAFDKYGTIWQLDNRLNDSSISYRILSQQQQQQGNKSTSQQDSQSSLNTGALSDDGYSISIAVTLANDDWMKVKKRDRDRKSKSKSGDAHSPTTSSSGSDSDSESVEPFTYLIQLWDLRNMSAPLHIYDRSHSDEIHSLNFNADQPSLLMSGGADGLVNIFDRRYADEDDALQSTVQMDSSVSRATFLSANRAYAITDDNCYSILRLNSPDDVDVLLRKKYASDGQFIVDILDCDRPECFYLLQSTGDGKATVRTVSNDGSKMEIAKQFELHTDLIRCVRYDVNQRLLVSAADDGCIVGSELFPPMANLHVAKHKAKGKMSLRQKPYAR